MIPLRHNKVFLKTTDIKNLNSTQMQWIARQDEESRLKHPTGVEFLTFLRMSQNPDESFKMGADKNFFLVFSSVCIK